MKAKKSAGRVFRFYHLLLGSLIVLMLVGAAPRTQAVEAPVSDGNPCCSSLDLSTLAISVPCLRVGNDILTLSLSYQGGTLFKLEQYALVATSPCSPSCCASFDFATWLVSLPCVRVGEDSLWATFSLVANSEGLFLDLQGYGFNEASSSAAIKEIILDTSQNGFFSFVTDSYADRDTFDVFAEPWCKPYTSPRLCGHFVSLGNRTLEEVTATDIPVAGAFPADIECQDLAVGNTCIFKNADGSYTAATIARHLMPADCTHKITLRYKSLDPAGSSCTTEP